MYTEEVTLGYCWTNYLLKISTESSTNRYAPPLAVTGGHSNTIVEATKSQQNLFPQNVTVDAATPFEETQEGKHSRERRSYAMAGSTISERNKIGENERYVQMIDAHIKRR